MRTVDQISREMKDAEAQASNPNLKGNKLYSAEQQRRLYQFRVEALRVELEEAEKARQATREAMLRVAQSRQ